MKLWSNSFVNGKTIPEEYAFGIPHAEHHMEFGKNRNPHIAWGDLPAGTKSLVLICHDGDVPTKPDNVNQEGKTVPASLPRMDFFHWTVVDLAPDLRVIDAGSFSEGVVQRGKDGPTAPMGARCGLNDYTEWFRGDPNMEGEYFGYDGPCPPWNDAIVHTYQFTLYALNVEKAPVEGAFKGQELRKAIERHVLDQAKIVGTYTLNPGLR